MVHADPWVRVSLGELLRDAGFSLAVASNGASGLRSIRQQHPDLILIGPELVEISRADLLELLRADRKTRAIPVMTLGKPVERFAWNAPAPDELPPVLVEVYRAVTVVPA